MPTFLAAAVASLITALPCWSPPVDAPVIDRYRAPACTYCPGNRGIEFGPHDGQVVTAVQAGIVTFAGVVAGTRYVTIDHGDGLRATYGRMSTVGVRRGQAVSAGDTLGTTTERFYFGLRRGTAPDDAPVDPTGMLGIRRYPARLVPIDGTPPLAAGPGRLACGKPTTAR